MHKRYRGYSISSGVSGRPRRKLLVSATRKKVGNLRSVSRPARKKVAACFIKWGLSSEQWGNKSRAQLRGSRQANDQLFPPLGLSGRSWLSMSYLRRKRKSAEGIKRKSFFPTSRRRKNSFWQQFDPVSSCFVPSRRVCDIPRPS